MSLSTPSTRNTLRNEASPSVTQHTIEDRKIVVYTLSDARHDSIDRWVAMIRDEIAQWYGSGPWHALHDLSASYVPLTIYMRDRLPELHNTAPKSMAATPYS